MMDRNPDAVFEAAIRMLLVQRSLVITFTPDTSVRIKFPITRELAAFVDLPHYLVLRFFAMMESEDLVMRVERVGIVTTNKGSRKAFDLLDQKYRKEAEGILGPAIFHDLLTRCREADT
ncbi:MAG: hypothetical protein GYA23_00470 [Methanomicrobiales archaeon]|nr:hypothetical protein [Methanomicrobiales archaeon]